MKKLVVYYNQFQNAQARHVRAVTILNPIVEASKRLPSEFHITDPADLKAMILGQSASEFFMNRLQGKMEPVKIFGIPVSRSKAVALLDLPDFSELDRLVAEAFDVGFCIDSLTFEKGRFNLTESNLQRLLNECTVFARTKNEEKFIEAFEECATAVEKFNKIAKATGGLGMYGDSPVSRYLLFYPDGRVAINPEHSALCLDGLKKASDQLVN